MNIPEIKNAIAEAERFIDRAKDLLNTVKREETSAYVFESYTVGKESGALRRASLDLTRALADMRKPT